MALSQRKPHALFGGPQRLGAAVAFDAERDVVGHRRQRRDDGVGQRMPGKERHDADDAAVHNQRVAGKRHHPFPPRPFLIVHFRIADDGVGQVRLAIPRDAPNLELSERDLSMRAVQMRVEARTRLQLEYALAFVEGPDRAKAAPRCVTSASAHCCRAWASESASVSARPTAAPNADSCARWRISSSARCAP